ncbi:hypothetical protein KJ953_04150 [Patescibacteria group bacterium]|nr:hypothetical protein [Patescibacteria group bacterium]
MKKRKVLIVLITVLVLVVIIIWNTPGVKSRRLGDQCHRKYNNALKTANSDDQDLNFEIARDTCFTNIAREYQNTQLCDRIADEQMESVCYSHVYYWNKSVEFCEDDDQRDICLHVVFIKSGDKSICNKINSSIIRKLCEK